MHKAAGQVTNIAREDERQTGVRPARFLAGVSAALLAIALSVTAWITVSTSVSDVSAAAKDTQNAGEVPYFPSLYTNQASEPSPVPPTF